MSMLIGIVVIAGLFIAFGLLNRGVRPSTHCDACNQDASSASCHHCGRAARSPEPP